MPRPRLNEENLKVKINLTLSKEAKNKLEKIRKIKNQSASEIFEAYIEKEWKKIEKKVKSTESDK